MATTNELSNRYCVNPTDWHYDPFDVCVTAVDRSSRQCTCEACRSEFPNPCEDNQPLPKKRSPYDDKAGRWFR